MLNIFSGKWGAWDLQEVINSSSFNPPHLNLTILLCQFGKVFVGTTRWLTGDQFWCLLCTSTAQLTPHQRQNLLWTQLWLHCHLWGDTALPQRHFWGDTATSLSLWGDTVPSGSHPAPLELLSAVWNARVVPGRITDAGICRIDVIAVSHAGNRSESDKWCQQQCWCGFKWTTPPKFPLRLIFPTDFILDQCKKSYHFEYFN